ncbi:hypothetical protein Ctob_004460 [Chrysochromulina tobinii]|uniref:Uncharacterized protein n=1 Tax=Chrysochromulina tobinii TaxID=1460289 RepID=A0A0M0K325_9EUKA|nr:hypothetical protein Ctob_004460 [Chrysochromulina tobinii]|eukprot:KOO32793.1 hypothetical protein Ctob_004460 [Chrysochromulina sp. CCMP291]
MQTVFRAHLTEHLADKRELVQPAVPPNIFDDVELPAEEVGAGADGAAAVEGVPKIASRVQECKSLSSRTTFDIPAFDLDGKKHNARLAYTIAKHGVVRWAHTHGNAQRQEMLAKANPFLEEAPVSYLQWLEDNERLDEREYFKKILCASFGNGKMQTVFRAHLTEHLADKRELVQPAVPPNIFDDVELPAEEVGAGEAAAEGVTPPTPVPSAPSSHLSPGTVERVADAMVQGMVARITPLHERTHSAVRDTHSAVLQGTAEVKSEVKNSAAEVKAEVKAGATEVKALILHSQEKAVKGFAALAMQNAQSLAQMMQALGLVTEHVTEAVTEAAKAAVEATERVGAVAEKTLTEASGARAAAVGAEAAATEGLCVTREVLAIVKEMETRLDALAFEKDKKEAIVGLLVNAPVARELSGCNKIIGTCVDLIQGLPSVEESRAADAEEALRAEAAAKAEAEAAAAAKRTASLRGGSAGLARAPPNASNTPKIVSKKPKAAPASGRGGTKAALTVAVETIAAPESDFLNASDKQVALRELITLLPMVPNENLLELLAPKGYVTLALVCALSYKKSAVVTTAAEVLEKLLGLLECKQAAQLLVQGTIRTVLQQCMRAKDVAVWRACGLLAPSMMAKAPSFPALDIALDATRHDPKDPVAKHPGCREAAGMALCAVLRLIHQSNLDAIVSAIARLADSPGKPATSHANTPDVRLQGVECCVALHTFSPQGAKSVIMCLAHNGAICDRLKEALAIIDKVTVDKMPLRNQLLKQLGPDAA